MAWWLISGAEVLSSLPWFEATFHLKTQIQESYINKILGANYQIPGHVSPEWKDLMRKILDTNPNTRITIQEIRNHPWYNLAVPDEKEGIIVGVNPIPVNNKILDALESYGFNFDLNDSKTVLGKINPAKVSWKIYTKKCIELNKHNHFTTSYYLLLNQWELNNGKLNIEISESMDRLGRKTSFPLQFKSSCRGNSVQIKDKNKIDPFAHLTPVARRFIEDSNIVTNSKAYSQNPNNRVNSTRINNKRRSKKPTPSDVFSTEKSSSPQSSARRPAINNYTKFTTTMVGSFRNKSGYSAPDAKRNSGYDTAKGPFFDSRGLNGSTKGEKRSSPYSLKRKPQLPNVSKQRVVIRSNNERYHYSQNSAYPNSIVNPNSSIRAGNNSAKRGTKIQNNSFQIVNNFMQTNYNGFGIGNFNQTQAQARKTTYGSLAYPSKNIQKPLNIVNFNKKSNLYNMKNLGYNPNISVATTTKESLRIHKSNKAGSSERRRVSDSGQKERFNCVGQLFGKQFGNHDKKPSVSTHQKIRR